MEKTKISVHINVPADLYAEYKKVLIDLKTNTTYDLIKHMRVTVEQHRDKN